MSKIVINNTASDINISDVGVTISTSINYTIPPQDYTLWASSDDVITLIGNQDIIISDGSYNLNISDAVDLIKGLFPNKVNLNTSVPTGDDLPVKLRKSDINQIVEAIDELKKTIIMNSKSEMRIEDGRGSSDKARVSKGGYLNVIDQKMPSKESQSLLIYKEDFMDINGSNDMRVSGTASDYKDFYIQAIQGYDIYITSISFRIADVNATADKFGTISALTNGCQMLYNDLVNGDIFISQSLKTNFDFLRMCQGSPSFGDNTTAFRIANAIGSSEGYIPVLDLKDVFGLPWGIKLTANSKEQLIIRIRDNVSGVDAFDAIAFGFKVKGE